MTARFVLERIREIRVPADGKVTPATWRELGDALRTSERNFQRIRDTIERAILTGGLIGDEVITLDMLAPEVLANAGDVSGTHPDHTVIAIQGKGITEPGVGEDGYLLQYNHGGGTIDWASLAQLLATILTTSGDILFRSGGVITRLGIGSAYSILAVNAGGTAPAYATLSALLDAAIGDTRGSVLYRGAAGWAILAPGTADQVFTTNGAGADPTWEDAGGGGTPPTDFDLLTDEDGLVLDDGNAIWIT